MNFATTLDVYQGTAVCGSFYYDLENFSMFLNGIRFFSFFVLIYLTKYFTDWYRVVLQKLFDKIDW